MKTTFAYLAAALALVSAGPINKRQSFPTSETLSFATGGIAYSPAQYWTHLTNQGSIDKSGTEVSPARLASVLD
jgi:hypothetical protein